MESRCEQLGCHTGGRAKRAGFAGSALPSETDRPRWPAAIVTRRDSLAAGASLAGAYFPPAPKLNKVERFVAEAPRGPIKTFTLRGDQG